MKVQKPFGHRRSTRLKGYDYTQPGAYFVTLLSWNRECLFGHVIDEKIILSDYGQILVDEWVRSFAIRREIKLDEFMVMPNHFHGIFWILNSCRRGNPCGCPNKERAGTRPAPTNKKTVGEIVGAFKSLTTNEYIRNVKDGKFPPFEKSVWQRNYYEHIIRDDEDLNRVREYIVNNLLNWELDELYPQACEK